MEAPALGRGTTCCVFWNCRDEHSGEAAAACGPFRQWLGAACAANSPSKQRGLVIAHRANPLDRQNFPAQPRTGFPASCDRRLLPGASNGLEAARGAPGWKRAAADSGGPTRLFAVARARRHRTGHSRGRDLWACRDWLVAPQGEWAQAAAACGRGMGGAEHRGIWRILNSASRQRGLLLRQALTRSRLPMPADPPDWSEGSPPGAAAAAPRRRRTWSGKSSISAGLPWGELLASFGEARLETHHWPGLSSDREDAMEANGVCWHGSVLFCSRPNRPVPATGWS